MVKHHALASRATTHTFRAKSKHGCLNGKLLGMPTVLPLVSVGRHAQASGTKPERAIECEASPQAVSAVKVRGFGGEGRVAMAR